MKFPVPVSAINRLPVLAETGQGWISSLLSSKNRTTTFNEELISVKRQKFQIIHKQVVTPGSRAACAPSGHWESSFGGLCGAGSQLEPPREREPRPHARTNP